MKQFDVTALGEILIDFTFAGLSHRGEHLFEQNPGGAPANVLAAIQKLGGRTSFIGKVGQDMHGKFLRQTLEQYGIDTSSLIESEEAFTTLAFVDLDDCGERSFSFARTIYGRRHCAWAIAYDGNIKNFHIKPPFFLIISPC